MPQDKAQEEFLKSLEENGSVDIFNRPLVETTEAPVTTTQEVTEEPANRRERRLQAKLQAERESGIAMAARLEALTEASKLRGDTESASFEKLAERIYGNQTPENAEATNLLINALKEVKETSKKEALEEFQNLQRQEREAVANEERNLDAMIEDIEDEFNITVDEPTQKAFFQMLSKLSPKDSDGEIVAYADPIAVWEELKSKQTAAPNTRAKDIAARSMVKTGAPADSKLEDDSVRRFLQTQGWDV